MSGMNEKKICIRGFKRCVVPKCQNTTKTTPQKTFILMPNDEGTRKVWCEAAGYSGKLTTNTYFCEDHFKLEEDLENYMEWKTMHCRKFLKKGVYPRFFTCQLNDSNPSTLPRNMMPIFVDVQSVARSGNRRAPSSRRLVRKEREKNAIVPLLLLKSTPTTKIQSAHADSDLENNFEAECILPDLESGDSINSGTLLTQPTNLKSSKSFLPHQETQSSQRTGTSSRTFPVNPEIQLESTLHKTVQVKPSYKNVGISCTLQDIPELFTSIQTNSLKENERDATLSKTDSDLGSTPSSEKTSKAQYLESMIYENGTKVIIERDPLVFLGLPPDSLYALDEFVSRTKIPLKYVYLTLKKIRQNVPNVVLGYEFGLSEPQVSRIFHSTVTQLADKFRGLIIWPSEKDIVLNLPNSFRLRHSDVQSVISCFEIQIEHPTPPVHQGASWSDYTECDTRKYLISITPNGLINFISIGFEGGTSNVGIVQNSGYVDALPSGSSVLADREFEAIDASLRRKNCKLLTKEEQQASLRISMNRVIQRLREFRMLQAHVTFDHNFIDIMDHIMVVACASINLQSNVAE